MANTQAMQEAILRAVDTIVTQRTNELELDKTITAIIKKNLGQRNGKALYQVLYSGGLIEAISQNDEVYLPNTAVYVLVPEGKFSNEKIIIGLANTANINQEKITTAIAENLYAKLGSNLLFVDNNNQYGLHSWHEKGNINDNDESHCFKYLYKKDDNINDIIFNQEALDTYKNNAIALMIKADFQTNLTVEQKQNFNARYGLIFNFTLNNLNQGYGKTNGEVFDNLAPLIKIQNLNEETNELETFSLEKYDIEIKQNDFSLLTEDKINSYIQKIKRLYKDFENSSDNTISISSIKALIDKYLILLNSLKNLDAYDKEVFYTNWRKTVIPDTEYKYKRFILTSDEMIGNPFLFNQWNTQYNIFKTDLKTLNSLDSIVFFQEGFNQDYNKEQSWPPSNPGSPDIWVKNLQLYPLHLVNQVDEYSLKVEPYNNSDFIITKRSDQLQFKATVLRKLYEDLTKNSNIEIHWFKESPLVFNYSSEGYNPFAGSGWKEVESTNNNSWILSTTVDENRAIQNRYKCVAVCNGTTILSYNFIIYNKIVPIEIKLESNLGTEFSFDAGVPTISIKIKDDGDTDFQEKGYDENQDIYPLYKYIWSIIDDDNVQIYLNNETSDAISTIAKETSWNNIKEEVLLCNGNVVDSLNSNYTTRISCPVSDIENTLTVMCQVQKKEEGIDEYYNIGFAKLVLINKLLDNNIIDYKIQIINDSQMFKYDTYGKAPTDESNKNPLKIQFLEAKLLTANNIEIDSNNYEVEWIFPAKDTSLLISPNEESNSIYGSQCTFDIEKNYDSTRYNNQITCHIQLDDRHFYKDTRFYFTKEGDNKVNGTDIIAKIDYAKNDDYNNVLNNEPVTLYIYNNNSFINTDDSRNLESSQIVFKDTEDTVNTSFTPIFETNLYQRSEKIPYSVSPIYNLAGNKKGKYFITGTTLIWNGADDSNDLPLIQNIKAEIKLNDNETYYAFVSLPFIKYEINPVTEENLISIDKDYYLNEVIYNKDGRNPIYDHNQGLKLNLPDNITVVEYVAKGGFIQESSGEYLEGTPSFALLENKNEQTKHGNITKIGIDKDIIYVIPNDDYTGMVTNNRIEARCYANNELIATVYAPINMTLDTFGLTSLSAWDGNSVTIDNEGGYVMAPQIGAGEKDNSNRFTGILMGKTETYTGGVVQKKQVGLFGYSCGLQSIFLDAETGNATFGLPEGYTIQTSNGTSVPVKEKDNYGEGRIELRPGGESKIGGWKIGRHSLYYTMKPIPIVKVENNSVLTDYLTKNNRYVYEYSGEMGLRYTNDEETPNGRQYAEHHEKDISCHDSGILISGSPPYISIVGNMLTENEINDISTAFLSRGDSVEIQLDPQTPTVFTIFRHNSEFRKEAAKAKGVLLGDRTFLAGINAKGQFQANVLGSSGDDENQTMLHASKFRAFDQTALQDPGYIGTIFEAGNISNTKSFLNFFMEQSDLITEGPVIEGEQTVEVNDDAHVYITGGNFGITNNAGGDNYHRDISIHGNSLFLYAKNSNGNGSLKQTDHNLSLDSSWRTDERDGEYIPIKLQVSNYSFGLKTIKSNNEYNWKLYTNMPAGNIYFGTTNFSGANKNVGYSDNGYYTISDITTLKDAIDSCLKAAGDARRIAEAALHRYNE